MSLTTSSTISMRTEVYAAREMLKHAAPVTVLDKLGVPIRMPKNKGEAIKFRRPRPFDAATVPLKEGVTPTLSVFQYEDVPATLRQYGQVAGITDVIEDTDEDPVLNDIVIQLGENIGRTIEALTYATVRGGTNVFFANGTQRTDVNSVLSLSKQRAVIRALKAQKAQPIRRVLSGSPDYATSPIEAAFVAVAHTDVEADIRGLTGFVPTAKYGTTDKIPNEIGAVEEVRYVTSPDLEPWEDAGGAKGSTKSTTGTNSDVYPVMYFGKDAFATIALRDRGAVSPTIIPVGQKTKDDPLGQRGYAGWKTWFTSAILNQMWMARLEVAVTDL